LRPVADPLIIRREEWGLQIVFLRSGHERGVQFVHRTQINPPAGGVGKLIPGPDVFPNLSPGWCERLEALSGFSDSCAFVDGGDPSRWQHELREAGLRHSPACSENQKLRFESPQCLLGYHRGL
jgi:hypothetical protein